MDGLGNVLVPRHSFDLWHVLKPILKRISVLFLSFFPGQKHAEL